MKAALLTGVAATGLFAGTMTGLLALQGRLNFEGTQGIPLLEILFEPPEGEMPEDGGAVAVAGGEGGADRLDGLGREERMPRAIGPSVENVPDPEEPTPRDSGGAAAETDADDEASADSAEPEEGWRQTAESVMGQDQYRRGKLFRFPRLDSGMSTEELDRILRLARKAEEELERRRAALDQREAEMAARESDVEERRRQVQELMREVLQARQAVREEIRELQRLHTIVERAEAEQYGTYARTLGALDAAKAADVVRQLWRTTDGRTKAVKILRVMSRQASEAIFGELSAEETREILDRVAAAVEEESGEAR